MDVVMAIAAIFLELLLLPNGVLISLAVGVFDWVENYKQPISVTVDDRCWLFHSGVFI